jgi:hypothetical protein
MTESPAVQAAIAKFNEALIAALNTRDMWINPDMFNKAAEEIDCSATCRYIWRDPDTGSSGCRASESGEFCWDDLAETLREIAKVARQV